MRQVNPGADPGRRATSTRRRVGVSRTDRVFDATVRGFVTPPLRTPPVTTARLHDPADSLSATFERTAAEIRDHTVTVRGLMALVGEQGLLIVSVFLSVPFLFPVAIPGTSTVFGLLIGLIGVGVMANRLPWLPARLLDHPLQARHVTPVLLKGAQWARRFERLIRPRWLLLTHGPTVNRFNGLMLVVAAASLLVPLPMVPFSNTIPALGIALLSLGMVERDGGVVVLGHLASLAGAAYVGGILWAAWRAGNGLASLFG